MKNIFKITEKRNVKIIAHRGASGLERENTLPAFVAAGNRSYYGIECDVHVTSDGKYLVYHDDKTGRLCDRDVVMEQTDFATLRALRIKASGTDRYSEAFIMPTLEEYLGVLSRYEKTAVVELKNPMTEKQIGEVVDICRRGYSLDRIIFISFDFENLVKVRRILPQQTVQFLVSELSDDLPERLSAHRFDLDIGHWLLTKEYIEGLHSLGVKVNCWTCDDPEQAERLIEWGVDYITSNVLE